MDRFLNKLRNNLYFLSKEEREKTVNKYKGKIDNSINEGLTEKDAINKLGTIEDIVKSICDEYNLNYLYCMRKNNLDKDITNISNIIGTFIRDIITAISDVTSSRLQRTLQNILRIIVLIFLFCLLKIPFLVVDKVLAQINVILFTPFISSFNIMIRSVESICYFIICLLLTIKVFGNYNLKERIISKKKVYDDKYSIIEKVIRIVIYLIILIPLLLLIIFNIVLLLFQMIIIINGVLIIGLPIITIGILNLLVILYKTIKDSMDHNDKTYLKWVIISIFLIIIGIILFVINYGYYNRVDDLEYSNAKAITEDINIELDTSDTKLILTKGDYTFEVDDTLEENNIRIEVTYYDEYVDILYGKETMNNKNYLTLRSTLDKELNYSKIIKNLIHDLKNKNIFNYSDVYKFNIKIYANSELKEKLEKYNK